MERIHGGTQVHLVPVKGWFGQIQMILLSDRVLRVLEVAGIGLMDPLINVYVLLHHGPSMSQSVT